MTIDPYQSYWTAVTHALGLNPRHRATAIKLSGSPVAGWSGERVVESLHTALDGSFWLHPANTSRSNWMWRETVPPAAEASLEVGVERLVAELSGPDKWTCQMPTLSGYLGAAANKRRSIDLVQRVSADRYRFIELKISSDNPVYAVFELLGYAVCYLHARRHGHQGSGKYSVLSATGLELVVLAPSEWYRFRRRTDEGFTQFDLVWLTRPLAEGLRALSRLDVEFRFESFVWTGDKAAAAADIHSRLG